MPSWQRIKLYTLLLHWHDHFNGHLVNEKPTTRHITIRLFFTTSRPWKFPHASCLIARLKDATEATHTSEFHNMSAMRDSKYLPRRTTLVGTVTCSSITSACQTHNLAQTKLLLLECPLYQRRTRCQAITCGDIVEAQVIDYHQKV